MANIFEKDGSIYLEGEKFDLKIDNNRKVYVKPKTSASFNMVGEIQQGYSSEEKKKYLFNFYKILSDRLNNSANESTPEEEKNE